MKTASKCLVPVLGLLWVLQAQATEVKNLLLKDLTGLTGDNEVQMITVRYAPGESSLPHRHNAHTFVYVLEGTVVMQVEGGPPMTLGAGETFYEGPDDVHLQSRNASDAEEATLVVMLVKKKGAPVTVPATPQGD